MKSSEQRRREGETRNQVWRELSPKEKLLDLGRRGHSHCKQAVKLQEDLDAKDKAPAKVISFAEAKKAVQKGKSNAKDSRV